MSPDGNHTAIEVNLAEAIGRVKPFDGDVLNVIVDTPKNSRNKYKFDSAAGMFALGGVLPAGHAFPYDFGFIPNTLGGDGDPLDVLIFMEDAAFVGCLVKCRLIGGIAAEQTELGGKTERNDRLFAVALKSVVFEKINSLPDLNKRLVDQLEHFFISYNEAKGKVFRPLERFGAKKAAQIVRKGIVK